MLYLRNIILVSAVAYMTIKFFYYWKAVLVIFLTVVF